MFLEFLAEYLESTVVTDPATLRPMAALSRMFSPFSVTLTTL